MTKPPAPWQWDVFCRVIDNFGDIGVCWRLVTQLAALGHHVRLWVDDASALQWMAPAGCPGVELCMWDAPPPTTDARATDVMVEAFGCEIAPQFIAYAHDKSRTTGQKPVWINLEYLSAESYVERNHRLPSLLMTGPAAGWTRWFFYPGFTAATGGLLREPDLMARRAAFDRGAWRARHANTLPTSQADTPPRRWVSLFCYEPPALEPWLEQCARHPTTLVVTPGRATNAVQTAMAPHAVFLDQNDRKSLPHNPSQLSISYLTPCPQIAFDDMLWACDFNAVRGEDSLVRALWAGQALVWHIYPQHDNAHHDKLWAFLDWLQAPDSLRQFHATWNGLDTAPLQWPDDPTLAQWTACIQSARERLLDQPTLVEQLLGFIAEKR